MRIYFTFPVTTEAAERSFSSLWRLKTYLRSIMTNCRLIVVFIVRTKLTNLIYIKYWLVDLSRQEFEVFIIRFFMPYIIPPLQMNCSTPTSSYIPPVDLVDALHSKIQSQKKFRYSKTYEHL